MFILEFPSLIILIMKCIQKCFVVLSKIFFCAFENLFCIFENVVLCNRKLCVMHPKIFCLKNGRASKILSYAFKKHNCRSLISK